MGYIMDLRALVGHRPLIQVGSCVILEDAQGRILLQQRTDDRLWSFSAAGSMEPGETAEEAMLRELLEETGLTARALELYGVFTGPQEHHVYPNGDEVYNVEFAYTCRDWSGVLRSLGLRRRLPDWRAHRRGLGASRSDRPFPR